MSTSSWLSCPLTLNLSGNSYASWSLTLVHHIFYLFFISSVILDPEIDNLSEVLLERNVSVISNAQCQERWDESVVSSEIHDFNMCVDEMDGVSACQVSSLFL